MGKDFLLAERRRLLLEAPLHTPPPLCRGPGCPSQDMACDTFLKIAQRCKQKFVVTQPGEPCSFIEVLCEHLSSIINDLEPHQVHTFYEAAGCMISTHSDHAVRERLVDLLMQLPNGSWDRFVGRGGGGGGARAGGGGCVPLSARTIIPNNRGAPWRLCGAACVHLRGGLEFFLCHDPPRLPFMPFSLLLNCVLGSIMAMAATSVEALGVPEVVTEFTRVVRTNERVCLTVGPSFAKQMGHLYADLLNCYAAFSNFISARCAFGAVLAATC